MRIKKWLTTLLTGAACAIVGGALLAATTAVRRSAAAPAVHLVLTNDNATNNTGTIMAVRDRSLEVQGTLTTGGTGDPDVIYGGENGVSIVPNGDGACLYITDNQSSDIAAFVWPALTKTGNYSGAGSGYNAGMSLAARGGYLFATYVASSTLGVWAINPDCSLTLDDTLGTVPTPVGVDITADSKYAAIAERNGNQLFVWTKVGLYPINSDGTLDPGTDFGGDGSFGDGVAAEYIRFSPDERFIYVTGSGQNYVEGWVTTLNFTESPLNVTYTGCHASPRKQTASWAGGTMAQPFGAGGLFYVASPGSTIYVLGINETNGCLSEVAGSPFATGKGGLLESLAAWPPRPF
jgi:hypothetical protein